MSRDIGQSLFDAWFDFTRPTPGGYLTADGNYIGAGVDEPRFDHGADGKPIGLLVEIGDLLGLGDRTRLQPAAIGATEATVLHARTMSDGSIERRAWYTYDPQATIDACLGQAGHHREIGAIPGFRRNLGGHVRFRGKDWQLTGLVGTGTGEALGDEEGRALIGS